MFKHLYTGTPQSFRIGIYPFGISLQKSRICLDMVSIHRRSRVSRQAHTLSNKLRGPA